MSLSDRCAIAVMAKAPQPGRVKTRLVPPLTPDQAMRMSAAFLRDITENIALAGRAAPIDGWIAYAPDGDAGLFGGLLAPGTQLLLADGSAPDGEPPMPVGVEGFGRCLLQATRDLLALGYRAACVLNADSPTLPTSLLVRLASELLAPGERVVLGPAEDGGYYVLGMQSAHARLFSGIAWSTEFVADQTRDRARASGLELVELPDWYDVDDREALGRLLRELAAPCAGALAPYAAPATAACVQRLRLDHAGATPV